jgi:hypothetical protein
MSMFITFTWQTAAGSSRGRHRVIIPWRLGAPHGLGARQAPAGGGVPGGGFPGGHGRPPLGLPWSLQAHEPPCEQAPPPTFRFAGLPCEPCQAIRHGPSDTGIRHGHQTRAIRRAGRRQCAVPHRARSSIVPYTGNRWPWPLPLAHPGAAAGSARAPAARSPVTGWRCRSRPARWH